MAHRLQELRDAKLWLLQPGHIQSPTFHCFALNHHPTIQQKHSALVIKKIETYIGGHMGYTPQEQPEVLTCPLLVKHTPFLEEQVALLQQVLVRPDVVAKKLELPKVLQGAPH